MGSTSVGLLMGLQLRTGNAMQLVLVRHGMAEDFVTTGNDADRQLTRVGEQKVQLVMRGLARVIEPPRLLLSSPKLRAQQTAELAISVWNCPLMTVPELAEENPHAVLKLLHPLPASNVMLVGHEPTLSHIAELLCARRSLNSFELDKAGAIALETLPLPGGEFLPAKLQFLATPAMLEALGRPTP